MKLTNTISQCGLPLLLLTMSTIALAQRPPGERLEHARIALITERLSLTPETAQAFWPIYNQINEQRMALRREGRRLQRAAYADSLTEAQAQARIKAHLNLKQQELALEETSVEKLRAVLSAQQILQLLRTERDFQRMVLRQLGRRGGKRH